MKMPHQKRAGVVLGARQFDDNEDGKKKKKKK